VEADSGPKVNGSGDEGDSAFSEDISNLESESIETPFDGVTGLSARR